MNSSNWTQTLNSNSKLAIVLSLVVFMQSCLDLPKPEERSDKENGGATFSIGEITGSSEIVSLSTSFAVPEVKRFKFNTCLKDNIQREPLPDGLKFVIDRGDYMIPTETSEGGCIAWSEDISYNYIADSKYIPLERVLIPKNNHQGQLKFTVVINPWLHGDEGEAVLDPLFNPNIPYLVPNKESPLALNGSDAENPSASARRSIVIEEVRLVTSEKRLMGEGLELNMEINASPKVFLKNILGDIHEQHFTKGKFKVVAHVVSEMSSGVSDQDERVQLSRDYAPVEVEMRDGKISTSVVLNLPYIPTRGQLQLWLSVAPVDGPPGLLEFTGVYHMGEYNQLKGAPFIRLKPSERPKDLVKPTISISEYATKKAHQIKPTDPYFVKAQYVFDPLTIRFVRYGKETATEREVVFTVYTCMRNAIDRREARAYPLTIVKTPEGSTSPTVVAEATTLDNGCFQWTDKLTHRYFERERLVLNKVRIKNADLDIDETLQMAINPWDFGFTFGRDTRLMSDADLSDQSYLEKPESQFYLNGFTYTTIGVDFAIDSLLNLKIYRRVIFRIDPLVLRYHSLTAGRNGIEHLRDGVYLLKLAIQRNGYENPEAANEYISSVEKLVQVTNNQIITPVEFAMDDVRLLGSRNNLLIELATIKEQLVRVLPSGDVEPLSPVTALDDLIDHDSGLDAKTFIGPIVLFNEDDGKAVMAAQNQSLLDLLAETTFRSEPDTLQAEQKAKIELESGKMAETSVAPTSVTATELIRTGKIKEAEALETAKKYASMENFLFVNDLALVDPTKDTEHPFLQAMTPLDSSQTPLGFTGFSPFQRPESDEAKKADIKEFFKTGKLGKMQKFALCRFWFDKHVSGLFPQKDTVLGLPKETTINNCQYRANLDEEDLFVVEQRYHVEEVGPNRYLKGFALNYNFGSSFGLSRSQGESFSHGWSAGADGSLGKDLKLGSIGFSGGYKVSKSFDSGSSSSVNVDISAATFLITEMSNFEITLNKYRTCYAIRLNPNLFMGPDANMLNIWSPNLTLPELGYAISSGYYICDPAKKEEPVNVQERYFYLSQHFASGHLQDIRDLRNRRFLLALRGVRDYNLFMNTIEARPQTPVGPQAGDFEENWALESIYPSFQMQKFNPSFPGTYQVIPQDMLSQ